MSRFDAPFVTLMGRNLMGDHTSFILVLLVPLYWVFPAAGTLFFAQALVIGPRGGAGVPVRPAAVGIGGDGPRAGRRLPAASRGRVDEPGELPPRCLHRCARRDCDLGALERHWRTYAVFVVLALLVKEDVALVVVPPIWVALKRDRRIGLITIIGSISFMLVAMLVVMRSLTGVAARNAWRIPFGGVGGFVETTFRRPGDVIDHFRSDGRPWYVWQMLTPFAYVFLRRPSVALIGSLALAANVVSTFWYQYHIQYHYSLVVVPPLAIGTAYAVAAFGRQVRWRSVWSGCSPSPRRTCGLRRRSPAWARLLGAQPSRGRADAANSSTGFRRTRGCRRTTG